MNPALMVFPPDREVVIMSSIQNRGDPWRIVGNFSDVLGRDANQDDDLIRLDHLRAVRRGDHPGSFENWQSVEDSHQSQEEGKVTSSVSSMMNRSY